MLFCKPLGPGSEKKEVLIPGPWPHVRNHRRVTVLDQNNLANYICLQQMQAGNIY